MASPELTKPPRTVRHYPTLGSAARKDNLIPSMRLWLLLKAYDAAGRGRMKTADIYHLFTSKRSKWKIYHGKRAIQHLLALGEGIFWSRNYKGDLWLASPANVANALGADRERGLPVLIPVKALLGSMGLVRAHMFAAYESGRKSDMPISQAALAEITGVPERAQRHYNQLLKRTARKNIVITGLLWNQQNRQDVAARLQRPIFPWIDYAGKRGRKGAIYVAYRIADQRQRCHKQANKGRLRKVNRAINLVKIPTLGKIVDVGRRYHPDYAKAGAAYNRDPRTDHLYPEGGGLQPNARRKPKLEGVKQWGAILAL